MDDTECIGTAASDWTVALMMTMIKSKYGATDILKICSGGGELKEKNIPSVTFVHHKPHLDTSGFENSPSMLRIR
jgi:hypothetical protein